MQTVPRAEIYALVVLVQNAPCMATLEYITDNKGLFVTFNKGPIAGARATNCDLYDDIFKVTIEKAITLSVRWMPSHIDEEGKPKKKIPEGVVVSDLDIKGNRQADILAGIAAKRVCVPLNVSAPILYHMSLVRRIQNRLATILTCLPDRPFNKHKAPKATRDGMQELLLSTSHVIFNIDGKESRLNKLGVPDVILNSGLRTLQRSTGSSALAGI